MNVLSLTEFRPYYIRGSIVGCALTGLICILFLMLHFALTAENRKKDRLYGKPDLTVAVDVSNEGDKAENFRYVT